MIFLGVLCVGAFGFLVYVVMTGVGKGPEAPSPSAGPRPPVAGLAWNDIVLPAPAGSIVAGAFAAGDQVVVHVNPPEGAPFLVIVDPKAGRVVGRVLLGARP